MADPWAEFRTAQPAQTPEADPWADFREKPMSIGEKAMDAYKGLGTGAIKGTLALGGMVGDVTNLGAKGIEAASNYVADKLGVERYQRPEGPSVLDNIPTTESLTTRLKEALGQDFYKTKSDYGKAAEAVGEFIPGAAAASLTGGGSLTGNLARYAVAPGIATFTAEKVLPETDYKPYLVAGAGLTAGLTNPSRVVTPLPASAARRAAMDVLEREGVTSLTAGQRTGNQSLRYLEDAASSAPMAGHGAARIEQEGQRQFTEAALRRAGTAGEATPEVLAANQRRLGQTFEDLSARNNLIPDNQMITDLTNSVNRYRNIPESQQARMLQGYLDDIIPHIQAGAMEGRHYQPMRSMLTTDARSVAQSDPFLSRALTGIRNSLDDAMERSIAINNPQDMGAWQTARREYAAQKLIEKAASRAGEATLEGQITAPNLRNAIPKAGGGYARGEGQFDELARAGATVMTPLPNSGTAQRTNAFHILNAGLLGIPQAAAGRVIMSPPVQSYLANQLMTGRLPVNSVAQQLALIEALQRSQQPYRGSNLGPLQGSQPAIETK